MDNPQAESGPGAPSLFGASATVGGATTTLLARVTPKEWDELLIINGPFGPLTTTRHNLSRPLDYKPTASKEPGTRAEPHDRCSFSH